MGRKYNQELPQEVEKKLDDYIGRIRAIKWFKPEPKTTKDKIDTLVNAAIKGFGIEASVEYRKLSTVDDYIAARDAARGAAWGAQDLLATQTNTYKGNAPFLKLVDLWEAGMYPCGVVKGKFIIYTPIELE